MITPLSHWGLYTENKEKPRKRGDLEGFDGLSQLIDGEKISLYIKTAGSECVIGSQFNYLMQGKGSRSNRYIFIEKFSGIHENIDSRYLIFTFLKHLQESLHPDENIIGFGNSANNWPEIKAFLDSEIPRIETSLIQYIFGKELLKLPVHIASHNPEFFYSTDEMKSKSPSSDLVKSIVLFIHGMDSMGAFLQNGFTLIVCDNFKKNIPDYDLIVHPGIKPAIDYNQKKFFGEPLVYDINLSEEKILVHQDTVKTALKIVDLFRSVPLSSYETLTRDRIGKSLKQQYISHYPDDLFNKNIMESEIGYSLGLEYILLELEKKDKTDESLIRKIYSQMHMGDKSNVIEVLAQEHLLCSEVVRDALPIIILKNNFDLFKKITAYPVIKSEDQSKISAEISGIFEKIDWNDVNDKTFNNGINILKRALDEDYFSHTVIARTIVELLYRYLNKVKELNAYLNKPELQKLETVTPVKKPVSKTLIILLLVIAACLVVGLLYYFFIFSHGSEAPLANLTNNTTAKEILQSSEVPLPVSDPNNLIILNNTSELNTTTQNLLNSSKLNNDSLIISELPMGIILENASSNITGS